MAKTSHLDDATKRRLYAVGLGVLGSATVLGGVMLLVRRQIASGDVVKVTLVHEFEPETLALVNEYLPSVRKMADDGLTHRVRMFGRPDRDELVGQLAPVGAATRFPQHLF